MEPTLEHLLSLAKTSPWKLEFGYSILAVVDYDDNDYVVCQVDWLDEKGNSKRGFLGPMKLIDVLNLRFSETLINKIRQIEEHRALDHTCFFVFGLRALYALLAEGLVHGTLIEKANGVFEGTTELDEKKYAFCAFETAYPMEGHEFLLADGASHPYAIL